MNERAIEPLNVVVFGEGQQDLVTNDREGQEEDRPPRHGQGERAQVESAAGAGRRCTRTHAHTHRP